MQFTFRPNCYAMQFCSKGLFLLFFLSTNVGFINAQSVLPEVWMKPDSLVGNKLQFSQHGLNWSALQTDSAGRYSAEQLNGNPVIGVDGNNSTFKLNTPWLKGRHLQVLIAYKPDTSQAIHGLYQFLADTNLVLGVTNNDVLQRSARLMYSDTLIGHGVVSSVKVFTMHTIPQSASRYLQVGKSDSSYLKGKLGEVLVFNRKTSPGLIPYYETYLALKYGICLNDGNYTTLTDTIWSKTVNATYHHDVAGLGTDSVCGLLQRTGESSAADLIQIGLNAVLEYPNTDQLQQGSYLVWGRNNRMWYDITQEPITYDSSLIRLNREWKIQTYGSFDTAVASFYVRFNTSQFVGLSNPLLLIRSNEMDPGTYYQADSIDATGYAYYRNIRWDTDSSGSDFFSFVFSFTQLQSNGLGGTTSTGMGSSSFSLNTPITTNQSETGGASLSENLADLLVFPVPSNSGVSSRVSVPGGGKARLEVYNSLGAKIDEFELQGSTDYLLNHSSLSQGQYVFVLLSGSKRVVRQVLITK